MPNVTLWEPKHEPVQRLIQVLDAFAGAFIRFRLLSFPPIRDRNIDEQQLYWEWRRLKKGICPAKSVPIEEQTATLAQAAMAKLVGSGLTQDTNDCIENAHRLCTWFARCWPEIWPWIPRASFRYFDAQSGLLEEYREIHRNLLGILSSCGMMVPDAIRQRVLVPQDWHRDTPKEFDAVPHETLVDWLTHAGFQLPSVPDQADNAEIETRISRQLCLPACPHCGVEPSVTLTAGGGIIPCRECCRWQLRTGLDVYELDGKILRYRESLPEWQPCIPLQDKRQCPTQNKEETQEAILDEVGRHVLLYLDKKRNQYVTQADIARNADPLRPMDRKTIRPRLHDLIQKGYVDKPGDGNIGCAITKKGKDLARDLQNQSARLQS